MQRKIVAIAIYDPGAVRTKTDLHKILGGNWVWPPPRGPPPETALACLLSAGVCVDARRVLRHWS